MQQLFLAFPDFFFTIIQPEHQAPAVFMCPLYFSALKIPIDIFKPLPPEVPLYVLPVPLHHSR